ncbi:unnamed protein product [Ophioblennius macclurei]
MNPPCTRCGRTVYPTEKVNCLDKIWHKGCFSCETCKMTLNMKNYKGFNKLPYCNAHYPKTNFTVVADTLENLRLKKQSLVQSHVHYKEDFEKSKGKAYAVADTPEMKRFMKTQMQVSGIQYHQKMKAPTGAEGHFINPGPSSQAQEAAPQPMPDPVAPPSGKRYRAVYDYTAADDDEVSFLDGDVIIDAQQIDEGWMYGRVERTGQGGMLPANYVEAI